VSAFMSPKTLVRTGQRVTRLRLASLKRVCSSRMAL